MAAAAAAPADRHLKPGKDIKSLSLAEFDMMIALIRPRVEELIPEACARMMPSKLKRPGRFDDAVAEGFSHPAIGTAADAANAAAWCRAARWKEPVPDAPPPAFFMPGFVDGKAVMDHVVDVMENSRKAIMATFAPTDFQDPEEVDDKVKDMLLTADDCPEALTKLSKERPSAFDVLASSYRYNPERIDKARGVMRRREGGLVGDDESFFELFKLIVPNSKQIIADLQRQAMQEQQGRSNAVNLE